MIRYFINGWKKILKQLLIVTVGLFLLFILLNLLFPIHDKIEYSTLITDNKCEVIHAFLTSDDKWRMKTELKEISPLLRKTIIKKEDKYFYYHPGVNPVAVVRAMFMNLLSSRRTSGASTITMQVARLLEPKRRTIGNKLIEMFRALQLEWKYSKEEILQLYLNLVPYGSNIEGVKSAALIYFNKMPDHLSLGEITALSIIPNRPSSLVMGKRNDLIVTERNKWLNRFAREKVFDKKQINEALREPLAAYRRSLPKLAPHLSYKLQHTGRINIQTHLDINAQLKTEKIVKDYIRGLKRLNINNAAVIIADNISHQVVTYVGSADFFDSTDAGQVDGAAAVRQPGSTLKPLVYGMCFDEGLLTPKTVITDVQVNYSGYTPENYDRQFKGYVSAEYALENSLNIPAVKALDWLGKDRFIQKLIACRFDEIQKKQKVLGLSLILGGCGTTLEEMTGLYSAIANGGVFTPLSFASIDISAKKTNILSPAASFMVTNILSRITRPDFPLNWQSTAHMPRIAWKTGTSYGRRDAWSIGYNKKYTIGVWVGNFSAQGIPELSGAEIATPLLFRIFNTMDYDADRAWYTAPEDCEQRMVCSETGMVPSAECNSIVMDYFIPLVSSTTICDNRKEIAISPEEKISYCKYCLPKNGYKKKEYKLVNPDMQRYFEENHIAYEKIPPHNPECERVFTEGGPVITSPANGTEYLIGKNDPEPLLLKCEVSNDVSKVYWYINNQFYKACDARSKQFFLPVEGINKISCTDDKGRNKDIRITVRKINL